MQPGPDRRHPGQSRLKLRPLPAAMFQLDAIARLLRDNDPATVQLVKSQLLQNPADNAPHLRDLLGRADDAVVTGHVRDILAAMEATQAAEEFDLLCRFFTDDG